ncbi:rhodanese-like domain-containing protein [Acetobacter sp. AN02]|uniref:rhodanese-like domain-containing protein n=1 Tax=Acetobacter sp. AN02 TaxID=2894186 RepID=UPI0024342EDF|nr:rhodanese-like domain-containing protein [Acetobacter sp. AN02]MDG6094439.1 rhodanese-like domain-containing protein [Acetobacter sp. AN02]
MIPQISPAEAWAALEADETAWLVDVRTPAEWQFVGIPDLSPLGRQACGIIWQMPDGQINDSFVGQLRDSGITPESRIYFICRSGARSNVAAQTAINAGFSHSFNVSDGFEGPPDAAGHRGLAAGWKASGLPWRQS